VSKVNTRQLVDQIAKLARERMTTKDVVSLGDVKALTKNPPVILVIEDDETTRRALHRILDSSGYVPLMARDALELSSLLVGQPIDLILLDVGLPWINGYEVAEMMKAHTELHSVPIVFLSGHNDMADIKKGFKVGAHDYITKPFEIDKVKKTIDTLLRLNA
jgi:two-component system, OmpR family, aerobic respiration control protein ArcA